MTMFMRKVLVMELLQCNYCNLGQLGKVDQSKLVVGKSAAGKNTISYLKQKNLNNDSKRFLRKQNLQPDNVLLFETLLLTPRSHIWLTKAAILSYTSNFFATIATHCNNLRPQVKNITATIAYIFQLSSAGSKGHVLVMILIEN